MNREVDQFRAWCQEYKEHLIVIYNMKKEVLGDRENFMNFLLNIYNNKNCNKKFEFMNQYQHGSKP
jgi:hypothetical protein